MDNITTIDQLKNKIKAFCEARDWDQYHNPKDLAIAISTEASELLEHFRWKSKEETKERMNNNKTEIEGEIADILIFTLRFCQFNNIDISDAIFKKLEINNKRYPINKSKGSNKKYSEL